MGQRRTRRHARTQPALRARPPLGLVVEGSSGANAVSVLLNSASIAAGSPINFPGQPVGCSVKLLVEKVILPRVQIAVLKGYSKILVILDRETRQECPGDFAQELSRQISSQLGERHSYRNHPPICVVVADIMLENWLIADPRGVRNHANIDRDIANRVGNSADGRNPLAVLNYAYGPRRFYQKTRDAPALASCVRVLEPSVRKRSKSLDKLLRTAGIPRLR